MDPDKSSALDTLLLAVGSFASDALLGSYQQWRLPLTKVCLQRIAVPLHTDASNAEQAILANLNWGIEALEEAIATSEGDDATKKAKLVYAEKMLQTCALLDVQETTDGVPNSYLSALAHFSLALVWNLQHDVIKATSYMLKMFIVDPHCSRTEFAPSLWQQVFLPQFTSIVAWYKEQHHCILTTTLPNASLNASDSVEGDGISEPALRLQELEQLYQDLLDENTKICAQYYRGLLDANDATRKRVPVVQMVVDDVADQPSTFSSSSMTLRNDTGIEKTRNIQKYASIRTMDSDLEKQEGNVHSVEEHGQMKEQHACLEGKPFMLQFNQGSTEDLTAHPDQHLLSQNSGGTTPKFNKQSPEVLNAPKELDDRTESSILSTAVSQSRGDESSNNKSVVKSKSHSEAAERCAGQERMPIEYKDSNIQTTKEDVKKLTNEGVECQAGDEGELEDATQNNYSSSMVIYYSQDAKSDLLLPRVSDMSTPVVRPLKDFICPITGHIFNDPVTLETGQTYERRAIQEWLNRGNMTCPITRQRLRSMSTPKTNYVLKRVIDSWKDQHPQLALEYGLFENPSFLEDDADLSQSMRRSLGSLPDLGLFNSTKGRRFNESVRSENTLILSPSNEVSQHDLQALLEEVDVAMVCLCSSNNLHDCESAVLRIAHIWQESKGDYSISNQFTEEAMVNGLLDVLFSSDTVHVLEATVYILSELIEKHDSVVQIIATRDPDYTSVIGLLRRGLHSAAVLLRQLKPTASQLAFFDLLPSFVCVLRQFEVGDLPHERLFSMGMKAKEAACVMIDQILTGADENARSIYVHSILSRKGLSALVDSLEAEVLEERISAVSTLLCCMQEDGICRAYIAQRGQLMPVLELLHSCGERARMIAVLFLSELVRQNRRSINKQILQVIKEEGSLSAMHILLAQLQTVPLQQRPIIAGLLLQLDLLAYDRKGNIFREESIEALVAALSNEQFVASQMTAVESLLTLGGRFSILGKPLLREWLLRTVGLDQNYNDLIIAEHKDESALDIIDLEDEETAAREWDMQVARALAKFENGTIFEVLVRGVRSQSMDLSTPCTVALTWLLHVLPPLPHLGVPARVCKSLMSEFVQVLKSHKHIENKALAIIGLYSFLEDSEGVQEILKFARDLGRPLRQLKASVWMANAIFEKLLDTPIMYDPGFWGHEILDPAADASVNGEVRSLAISRGILFSGHADGALKVWNYKHNLDLIQDIKKHTRSVTCMYVSSSGKKLYSGSLDKTIRVWALGPEGILYCLESHDTKEPVQSLVADPIVFCFAIQGSGVRVIQAESVSKTFLVNKNIQSLAIAEGRLFCGCSDYSIQEVDTMADQSFAIQPGVRTLLAKKTIYSLEVFGDKLYSAGSLVDGVGARVWSHSERLCVGELATNSDIRALAITDEFLYLGSSSGFVEVWMRERLVKIFQINISSRVNTLIAADNVLFCGSEDGKIRRWVVN